MCSYRLFNLISLSLAALFGLATVWLWREYSVVVVLPALEETHLALFDMFNKDDEEPAPSLVNEIIELAVNETAESAINVTANLAVTTSLAIVSSSVDLPAPDVKLPKIHNADSLLTGKLALGPDDINLKVPYTSQAPERNWEQPWQDACEEAALLMLDAYYKGYGLSPLFSKDEILKIIAWEEERGWGTSIEIEKIRQIATEYLQLSGEVKIIEDPTAEQIKKYVARGKPVLLVAYGKELPNRFYSRGGPEYHALIIRGYTSDKFITNDPGVNRGENFPFKIEDVMKSIHDWNNGDVPRGRRVALVVD